MRAFPIFLVRVLSHSRQKHLGRVIFLYVSTFYASIQYSISYMLGRSVTIGRQKQFRRVIIFVRVIIICKHLLFFSSEFCIISVKFISVESYFFVRVNILREISIYFASEFFQFRVKSSSAESNIWYVSLFYAWFQCFARQKWILCISRQKLFRRES
jgi:hypothetical protein